MLLPPPSLLLVAAVLTTISDGYLIVARFQSRACTHIFKPSKKSLPPLRSDFTDDVHDDLENSNELEYEYETESLSYLFSENKYLSKQAKLDAQLTFKNVYVIIVGVEDLSYSKKRADRQAALNFSPSIGGNTAFTLQESLEELTSLSKTAGLTPVATLTQRLSEINPRTFIGTGKVNEVIDKIADMKLNESIEICTVCFDTELSPRQLKYLSKELNKGKFTATGEQINDDKPVIKVLDRTMLILDIFATRASTREATLQVSLAMESYRAPRLTNLWTHLERQGGVGNRGAGEKQLETDKRLMRGKIQRLKKEIDEVGAQRAVNRNSRNKRFGGLGVPNFSLVGYTNSGKSSLLNLMCGSTVMAEDVLFATLDPTTRRVVFETNNNNNNNNNKDSVDCGELTMTDTVGFIQKLPTLLVAAFRATLEEVREADVLCHVIDVSNLEWRKQEESVLKTLAEIGVVASTRPMIRVLNKVDKLRELAKGNGVNGSGGEEDVTALYKQQLLDVLRDVGSDVNKNTVLISVTEGENIDDLVSTIKTTMMSLMVAIDVTLPYEKMDLINTIYEVGVVDRDKDVEYVDEGVRIKGMVPPALANRLGSEQVDSSQEDEFKKLAKRRT